MLALLVNFVKEQGGKRNIHKGSRYDQVDCFHGSIIFKYHRFYKAHYDAHGSVRSELWYHSNEVCSSDPKRNALTCRNSHNTLATIKIHGGGSVSTFVVPTALITSRSDFCKNALKQCWQESNIRTIDLWDQDPKTFALYLKVLDGKILDLKMTNTVDVVQHTGMDYATLFQIYVLAEFLQDPVTTEVLKRYLWDALFEGDYTKRTLRSVPSAEALHILYDGTVKGCAARNLVLDTFAHANLTEIVRREESWPEEFTRDLVLKLYEQVDWRGGRWSNNDALLWRLKKEDYFRTA